MFLPDFDPGALDTLLAVAAKNNNRDLWAIIPKQAGSVEAVRLATYRDEQGTLNGSSMTVHHLVATIGGADMDLFSGPENELLQAELPQDGFALVRNGFVLKPPTKAPAPPAALVGPPRSHRLHNDSGLRVALPAATAEAQAHWKLKPPEMARDVDGFPNEEEAGTNRVSIVRELRLGRVDSACGDFGFSYSVPVGWKSIVKGLFG